MSLAPCSTPEIELKFQVKPEDLARVREHQGVAGSASLTNLRSVYFDTPNHYLRRHGLTLRVRTGGERITQTVKRQDGQRLFDRDEWEAAVENEVPDSSKWAGTPLAKLLKPKRVRRLTPVFVTTVERASQVCEGAAGQVEVSVDQGEISAGDLRQPINEVEFELKGGSVGALFEIVRSVGSDPRLTLSFESKAERGYQLVHGQLSDPRATHAPVLKRRATAREAFPTLSRACLPPIASGAELMRHSQNPEVIHQLRISIRRLRTVLAVFAPMLAGPEHTHFLAELLWFGGELDAAREIDVLIRRNYETKRSRRITDPTVSALIGELDRHRAAAYHRAATAFQSDRFAGFLLEFAEWVEMGGWLIDSEVSTSAVRNGGAGALAAEFLNRMQRRVRKDSRHLSKLTPTSRHKLRIKIKNIRYCEVFFRRTLSGASRRRLRAGAPFLSVLQADLGSLNDLECGQRFLAGVQDAETTRVLRDHLHQAGSERRLLSKATRALRDWRSVAHPEKRLVPRRCRTGLES